MPPDPSLRDPAGCCFDLDDRVLRVIEGGSLWDVESFLQSGSARKFWDAQRLIPTRALEGADLALLSEEPVWQRLAAERDIGLVLEHERVAFPSFPYEWPPEMLWAAGRLTLELAQESLEEDFCLKDATPYNILFRGSKPVFVDLLSFERRAAGNPIWNACAQFVRTFLLPLLVNRHWGIPLADVFIAHRDGLEPQTVYRMCGALQKFRPLFFSFVSLPTWLSPQGRDNLIYRNRILADEEKARFIVKALFARLGRALEKLKPAAKKNSAWSGYMESHSYTAENLAAKETFVSQALMDFQPSRVLDVGANTGHFSLLAAERGAEVVALDSDSACVGALWEQAFARNLNILPLTVDLARPTPAIGWRNRECPGFLERAAGQFDAVLMLAVLHHLMVTERIPLHEILDLAAELTTELLLIEFVGPQDEMFRRLCRGREELFCGFDSTVFERACRQRFEILRTAPLSGTHRRLYLLRKLL